MKITKFKEKMINTLLVLVAIAIMQSLDIKCFFKELFNICCPGCGMTRAYISLFHLDIKKAFEFNAMFLAAPICYLFYLFDDKVFKQKWLNTWITILVYAGLFVNWIYMIIASK